MLKGFWGDYRVTLLSTELARMFYFISLLRAWLNILHRAVDNPIPLGRFLRRTHKKMLTISANYIVKYCPNI